MKTLCILSLTFMMVYTASIAHNHNDNSKPLPEDLKKLKCLMKQDVKLIEEELHKELLSERINATTEEERPNPCVENFFCLVEKSLKEFRKHSSLNGTEMQLFSLKRLTGALETFNKMQGTKCELGNSKKKIPLGKFLTHIRDCISKEDCSH